MPARMYAPALAIVVTLACSSAAPAAVVPGELLVGFRGDVAPGERADARADAGVHAERALGLPGVQLVAVDAGTTTAAATERLRNDDRVRYVEPNRIRYARVVPDDDHFDNLWGLENIGQTVLGLSGAVDADIDAPAAWDIQTGDPGLIVGVVDEGVAYDHPDLAPNISALPDQDFADDDADARDFGGHGTHVAGTIAAAGNNATGVVGVAWQAALLPVRALNGFGGTDASVAAAFDYAGDQGARIVNASLGGPGFSQTISDAVSAHPQTLFVIAAGNDGQDNDSPVQAPAGDYPCNLTFDNVICVAATNQSDALASFSNTGSRSVDLAAPGTNIRSTYVERQVVFSDRFESAAFFAANWAGTWDRTSSRSASGSSSVTDSPGGDYPDDLDGEDSVLRLKNGANLSGKVGCTLDFELSLRTEAGFDHLVVERSLTGTGDWLELGRVSGTYDGGAPQLFEGVEQLDLQADGDSSVFVRFRLTSDSDVVFDGAYVDDLAITCSGAYDDLSYAYLNGTSMATPHVAGAAALLWSEAPAATLGQVRCALLATGDPLSTLAGKTVTGRRLNAAAAVAAIASPGIPLVPVAATRPALAVGSTGATLTGTVEPRCTATSYRFDLGPTAAYGTSVAGTSVGTGGEPVPVSAPVTGLEPATTYHYRVVALRGSTEFPGQDMTFTTAGTTPATTTVTPTPVAPPAPTVAPTPLVTLPPPQAAPRAPLPTSPRLRCIRRSTRRLACRVSVRNAVRVSLRLTRSRRTVARRAVALGATGRAFRVVARRRLPRGRYVAVLTLTARDGRRVTARRAIRL